MYRVIGYWSAPTNPSDVEAFEDDYQNVHVPFATKLPGLRSLATTKLEVGHGGGDPLHYRIAELVFDSREAVEQAQQSPEYAAMGADAGRLAARYGVTVTGEAGVTAEAAPVSAASLGTPK